MNKTFKYVITKEDKYYVSRCLNNNVSSFGESIDEAICNLKEVLALYYEDENTDDDIEIEHTLIGDLSLTINA